MGIAAIIVGCRAVCSQHHSFRRQITSRDGHVSAMLFLPHIDSIAQKVNNGNRIHRFPFNASSNILLRKLTTLYGQEKKTKVKVVSWGSSADPFSITRCSRLGTVFQ